MKKVFENSSVKLRILHLTQNRTRLVYELKNTESKISVKALESAICKIQNVKSARINPKLKNIILDSVILLDSENFQNLASEVLKIFQNLKGKNFDQDCENFNSTAPQKTQLIQSALALAINFLIPNAKGASQAQTLKNPLTLTKGAISFAASYNLLKSGVSELKNDGITSRVLEALAVAISLYRKDFSTADSTNFMLNLGEYIEELTVHKSDDLLKELSRPQVGNAWVEKIINGKKDLIETPSDKVKVGDIVVVGAGDAILVDGHIVDGQALVNQISMTGEATPVSRARGDRVLSGTIVQEGQIKIWAENVGTHTAAQRIRSYMQETLEQKSSIQLNASKMADKLVPVTLGLSALSFALYRNLENVASVLQADYSCALKIATPVAFKSAISNAGKNGIIIKGAKSLESLNEVEIFVFDKTGTLTKGELEVVGVHSFDKSWNADEILNLSASIEEHYFHPVAEAVVKAAKKQEFTHIHHDEVTFIVAHGVKSVINGKEVIIGNRHFLEDDEHIDFNGHTPAVDKLLDSGHTPLFIAYDGRLLGLILLKDTMRENAKRAIERLRKSGIKEVVMLTGDEQSKAQEIAQELGIDRFYAKLLPTQKAEILDSIMSEGKKVAFVGDGINDAPALIKAHTGIGMHKGADIAKASADIVLLQDDVESVAVAREFAVACLKKVRTNFKITLWVNSAILGLATFGKLSPIQTAFLHNGTTIVLLLNALKKIKIKER